MNNAISTSPTKSEALPLPVPSQPSGGRRHRHQRSGAVSSHDLSSIMQPREPEPRPSSSLPTTPLEYPADSRPSLERTTASESDLNSQPAIAFSPPQEDAEARPPSRRTVGFSETVQFIPRPLSTISSETERSVSPSRGHSVNNSISSVLSLSAPNAPSAKPPCSTLSTTYEDDVKQKPRSSIDISKRIEKEGEWLRSSSSSQNMRRPVSESAASPNNLSFAVPDAPARARNVHGKKHSLSHALGLDRRRSEPVISLQPEDQARLSAISLQEEAKDEAEEESLERKKSSRRLRDWAASKLGRKSRDLKRRSAEDVQAADRPESAGEVPGKVPFSQPAVAETDLDAVFNSQNMSDRNETPLHPRIEVSTPSSFASTFQSLDGDDSGPMLDLDAALGPFNTPGAKPRKELHSSRLNKDFTGPGMHYHRRTESAPTMGQSGFMGRSSSSQLPLPDLKESREGEEEAVEDSASAISPRLAPVEEGGIGIQVVDVENDSAADSFNWGTEGGLGIQRDEWEVERPANSSGSASARLSSCIMEQRRGSRVLEETIPEEMSPVDQLEIVEAHEEPRTSSVTKHSDSSETPTILASQTSDTLQESSAPQSLMTPDTYQTSTFSSPDVSRRQGSFDTSRIDTSASSIADNRTMSSCAGEHGHGIRMSVDDVPSLTSSRSTMLSTMHANTSRRDFSSGSASGADDRTSSVTSRALDPAMIDDRRKKRASIQSLSQLVGGSFHGKAKDAQESRPQTAIEPIIEHSPKKEHRLKKLMFWRSKSKQSLRSNQ